MSPPDPHDLARFRDAQAGMYPIALAELERGLKESHWMWFVFPQMRGLGFSSKAAFYGIASLAEAKAYLDDPVLGPRLSACARAVPAHRGQSLVDIFGKIDSDKFRSSMTLFDRAAEGREPAFREALDRFCEGRPDPRTLQLLAQAG